MVEYVQEGRVSVLSYLKGFTSPRSLSPAPSTFPLFGSTLGGTIKVPSPPTLFGADIRETDNALFVDVKVQLRETFCPETVS